MPVQLQFRRGTTAELSAITGLEGELFVDTSKKTIVVSDGVIQGGYALATESMIAAQAGGTTFVNVAALKAASLVANQVVRTTGYRTPNDGGHGYYLILSPGMVTPNELSDHTIANDNVAVLLYSDRANIMQFGAFNDGATDNTDVFIAAGAANVPLTFPYKGAFYMGYTTFNRTAVFSHSVDFNHSRIIFGGQNDTTSLNHEFIKLTTPGEWYTASNLMRDKLKLAGQTFEGKYATGWYGFPDAANKAIKLTTNQPYYTYRGTTYNRVEMNVHTREGQMVGAMKYPVDVNTITALEVMDMNDSYTVYENMVFELGEYTAAQGLTSFVTVRDANKIKLKNISYNMPAGYDYFQEKGLTVFAITDSVMVEVDGLYAPAPIKTTAPSNPGEPLYSYTFQHANCFDITWRNVVSQGDGWGSIGANDAWRVTYENCNVNRIDQHTPVNQYMKIKDCDIGNWGIQMSIIGDMFVDNTTITNEPDTFAGAAGIIAARADIGGWCDGHLVMRNCTINNFNAGYVPAVESNYADVYAPTFPAGSPVTPWAWETQTYDNCIVRGGAVMFGNFTRDGAPYLVESESITMTDCRTSDGGSIIFRSSQDAGNLGWSRNFRTTLTDAARYYNARPNRNITVRNSDIKEFAMYNDNPLLLVDVLLDNVNGDDKGTQVFMEQQGVYVVRNSDLNLLSFGNTADKPVKAVIENNTIRREIGDNHWCFAGISNQYWGGRGDDVCIKNNAISVDWQEGESNPANVFSGIIKGYATDNTVGITSDWTDANTQPYRTFWHWDWNTTQGIPNGFDFRNDVFFAITNNSGSWFPQNATEYQEVTVKLPQNGGTTFGPVDATSGITVTNTGNSITFDNPTTNNVSVWYKF